MKKFFYSFGSWLPAFSLAMFLFNLFLILQVSAQGAGKALNFNGTHKYVSVPNSSTLNFSNAMTLEAWMKSAEENFSYQVPITLNPATPIADYQVKVELTTSNFAYAHASSDGSDIRFYDGNGTELNYWMEKWDASGTSIIWVKVPIAGTNEIFMHYGNSSAQSASNATNTFVRVIDSNSPVKGSWHLDEGSGTTAYDRSGNGNNGTLYNSPAWVDGKFGKALSFDGSNDYVTTPIISNTLTDFTMEAWVKASSVPSNRRIVMGSGWNYNDWYIGINLSSNTGAPARKWLFWVASNSQIAYVAAPDEIVAGDWYYLVATYEGTTGKFYINGNYIGSFTFTRKTDTNPFQIGRSYSGEYFNGLVDEVRVYNRALTSAEVSDLYQNYGYTTTNAPGQVFVRKYSAPEPAATVGNETVIRIKYVATNGSNTPPYDTWGKAATSIQVAINAANPGDTIIVGSSGTGHGDGVYTENINVTKSLTIKSESGYATTTVIATNANDHVFEVTANNVTIGGEGCGFSIYGATGSGYFTYYAGIYLSGTTNCTIHDNRCGWDSEHYNTEGIYLFSSSNNTITGNATSSNNDCGIFLYYFSSNNTITNNSALNNNYGIYLHEAGNNTVMGNTADNNKLEGIHLYNSNANTFTGNTASSNAYYGIYLYSSSNNTFYLNNLYNNHSGNAYVYGSFSVNSWNSPTPIYYDYTGGSFHKNYIGNYYGDYTGSDTDRDGIGADSYNGLGMTDNYPLMTTSEHYSLQAWWLNNDGKMYRDDRTKAYGNVTLNAGNSQIWIASEVATKNISYSGNDTWKGQIVFATTPANGDEFTVEIGSSTDGNDFISGGPQAIITGDGYKTIFTFETNAAAFNLTNGNYLALRLTNNSSAYNHKVQTGGAWSYCSSAEIVTESPTGKNENILPHHFSLFQNQPNPFVTTTMIRYELPERSSVVLKVYDLLGREVTTLFEGEQNDGKYEVEFNGTNLPGGIYFYQLQAGNFRTVRKLLLLK